MKRHHPLPSILIGIWLFGVLLSLTLLGLVFAALWHFITGSC